MKTFKSLFLLSFLTVFACEEEDFEYFLFSGGGGDCKFSIKPPEWIRGTWHNNDNDNFITDFIFTKNDAKDITSGSNKAVSLSYSLAGNDHCNYSESIKTENSYKLEIGTLSYEFLKIDNNTIKYSGSYYTKK